MINKNTGNISIFIVAIALTAIVIGGLIGWRARTQPGNTAISQTMQSPMLTSYNQKQMELSKGMRKLWEDHITWTRMYLVSAIYGNEGTDEIANRLMKNQEDIGNAIKPYYGNEAGNRLTALLKEHISIAVDLVAAAKAGDKTAQDAADEAWTDNANQIADLLSGANPNWSKDDLSAMLQEHLDLTRQEAVNLLNKNFKADIADYDRIHDAMLIMADTLTDGIIKQFPEKF